MKVRKSISDDDRRDQQTSERIDGGSHPTRMIWPVFKLFALWLL
jgi:hypothetical protein